MPDICIITDRHLSTNPRVWKEAQLFSESGYNVTIITQFNSAAFIKRDKDLINQLALNIKYLAAVDISGTSSALAVLWFKLRAKLALVIKKYGIESRYLLSHAPEKIYAAALREDADLYIAHVECGLYAGLRLIRQGKKVAFDFEDWYSEDYLVSSRPVKLLKKLEINAVNSGIYISCPSVAMADALNTYATHPVVIEPIYNSFPDESVTLSTNKKNDTVSLLWFSQTIGVGRGLEKFINSLQNVRTKLQLTLIGNCNEEYKRSLQAIFPSHNGFHLQFIPLVTHRELYSLMQEHDIGLALEDTRPDSRNRTITNKILQYLQSGLKVLATATTGQKEVADKIPSAVMLVNPNDNIAWGSVLEELIAVKTDKNNIIEQYNHTFGWQTQERKLLTLVADALAK